MFTKRKELRRYLYEITSRVSCNDDSMVFVKSETGALDKYDTLKGGRKFGIQDIKYILDGRYCTDNNSFEALVTELQKILDTGVSNIRLIASTISTTITSAHRSPVHDETSNIILTLDVVKNYHTNDDNMYHGSIKLSAHSVLRDVTYVETLTIRITKSEDLSFVFTSMYSKKIKGGN